MPPHVHSKPIMLVFRIVHLLTSRIIIHRSSEAAMTSDYAKWINGKECFTSVSSAVFGPVAEEILEG